MIYNKPIDSITWKDIENLCSEGISENEELEYKKDFPNDLAKSVAGLANNKGGMIIIGLKGNDENKPILEGIELENGLEEKAQQKIDSNLIQNTKYKTKSLKNNNRVIIIIKVEKSKEMIVKKNGIIPVRRGCTTEMEKYNYNDYLKYKSLYDRFKNNDSNKQIITPKDKAIEKYGNIIKTHLSDRQLPMTASISLQQTPLLSFTIVPNDTNKKNISVNELKENYHKIIIIDSVEFRKFPKFNPKEVRTYGNGIYSIHFEQKDINSNAYWYVTLLTCEGILIHSINFPYMYEKHFDVEYSKLLDIFELMCKMLFNFVNQFNLDQYYNIETIIERSNKLKIIPPRSLIDNNTEHITIEKTIKHTYKQEKSNIEHCKTTWKKSLLSFIHNEFNIGFDPPSH